MKWGTSSKMVYLCVCFASERVYQYSEWLLGSHKRQRVVILGIYNR